MKKLLMLGILLMFFSGGFVFGDKKLNNSISGGINLSGVVPIFPSLSLEYERLLGDRFSVNIGIGTNVFIVPYAEIGGRFYPWSGMFFVGLNFGVFGLFPDLIGVDTYPMITPEFGWKIDFGQTRRWFLMPSAAGRIFFDIHNDEQIVASRIITVMNLKIGYRF